MQNSSAINTPCTTIDIQVLEYFLYMTMVTIQMKIRKQRMHSRAGGSFPPFGARVTSKSFCLPMNVRIHDITMCGQKTNMAMGMNNVYIPSFAPGLL